jgi:predicted nucleic acid-binding protein
VRVFLDTNVLISAFAARGLCADLMRLLLAEHEVLTGEVNVVKLRRVLTKRFKATAAQVDVIEQLLRDQTVIPKPAALLSLKVPWVLASAVAGAADLLVSGDQGCSSSPTVRRSRFCRHATRGAACEARASYNAACYSHAIVAAAARPHFMECLQHKPTLATVLEVKPSPPRVVATSGSPAAPSR